MPTDQTTAATDTNNDTARERERHKPENSQTKHYRRVAEARQRDSRGYIHAARKGSRAGSKQYVIVKHPAGLCSARTNGVLARVLVSYPWKNIQHMTTLAEGSAPP